MKDFPLFGTDQKSSSRCCISSVRKVNLISFVSIMRSSRHNKHPES